MLPLNLCYIRMCFIVLPVLFIGAKPESGTEEETNEEYALVC